MTAEWTPEDVELVAAATARHRIADGYRQCTCGKYLGEGGSDERWDDHLAEVALAALAEAGRLVPAGAAEPDLWQYAAPDVDAPSGLTIFVGEPRWISPRWFRRPLRAVGPWQPVEPSDVKEKP